MTVASLLLRPPLGIRVRHCRPLIDTVLAGWVTPRGKESTLHVSFRYTKLRIGEPVSPRWHQELTWPNEATHSTSRLAARAADLLAAYLLKLDALEKFM